MSDEIEWPREVWMAELEECHNGQGRVVLSEFATEPRYEGCPDTDVEFQRYVDADIYESAEKYYKQRIETLEAYNARLIDLLNTIATLTATGDGLGPDEVITIHCLSSRAALQDKGEA